MRKLLLSAALLALSSPAFADSRHKVDSRNLYHRVWAVVPMIGAGTHTDPKRPLYAPVSGLSRDGIVGFSSVISDDGKFALVEFIAVNPAALSSILLDSRQDVKRFEKGKVKEADVEKEFRKYKKDFDIQKFGAGMQ